MMEFPNEVERKRRLQTDFANHFEFAERLLRFWLHYPKDRALGHSPLPGLVLDLAMTLNVQACRQFRTVIEECRRGESYCANIVSRSLFESVLAQRFVLAKRVRIVVEPMVDKITGQPRASSAGAIKYCAKPAKKTHRLGANDCLPRNLRAYLYFAHQTFEDERRANDFTHIGGLKRLGQRMRKEIDPAIIAHFEQTIGPEWSYVLRNSPRTYSGLSVATLSRVLHRALHRWYESVYRIQSGMTHAADALRHVELHTGNMVRGMYVSAESEAIGALQTAVAMFLANIATMQDNIGFGAAVGLACTGFNKEFREVFS